jgi:hypothetical protein
VGHSNQVCICIYIYIFIYGQTSPNGL